MPVYNSPMSYTYTYTYTYTYAYMPICLCLYAYAYMPMPKALCLYAYDLENLLIAALADCALTISHSYRHRAVSRRSARVWRARTS
jgi:hypothetical protein